MPETANLHEELKKSEIVMAEDGRRENSDSPENTRTDDHKGLLSPEKTRTDDHKEQKLVEAPPEKLELVGWYIFSFSSYFVHSFLIPVLFPLMIAQRAWHASDVPPPSAYTPRGVACSQKEMDLYQRLVYHSIMVDGSKFSPLQWTTVSWAAGIVVAVPLLVLIAHHLDDGSHQPTILIGAIVTGAFSCLLTGFFKTIWIFPLCIAAIAVASLVGTAVHGRHLGLMVRGLTAGGTAGELHFKRRRAVGSLLSLHGTAAGSLGGTVMAAFTYHMLRRSDQLTSLWVVFIFSGIQWLAGVAHATLSSRPGCSTSSRPVGPTSLARCAHVLTIFNYPHAIGGLAGVFLSSFACMCIFASGTLYIVGDLCIRPLTLLLLWMIYFTSPAVSLPALYPAQLVVRADAVSMQLLGFFMSAFTSGLGFYFKEARWKQAHILLVGLLQSTADGVLHAFGRALVADCAPAGKEGAFAAWFSWARAVGGWAGYAVGTASPGDIKAKFAAAFLASFVGVFVLVFGNVSSGGGMAAAGHGKEEEDRERSRSPASASKLEGNGDVRV